MTDAQRYEVTICSELKRVLDTSDIQASTDLFTDLRLNSLNFMGLVSALRKKGLQLNATDLFEHSCVGDLARHLANAPPRSHEPNNAPAGPAPFSPSEIFWKACGWGEEYQMSGLLGFEKGVYDGRLLLQTLEAVFVNSPDLWTTISDFNTQTPKYDLFRPRRAEIIRRIDLQGVCLADAKNVIENSCQEARGRIKFGPKAPLVQVVVFENLAAFEAVVFFAIHHFIIDGYSFRLLMQKLSEFYSTPLTRQIAAAESNNLIRWSRRVNAYIESEVDDEVPYWRELHQRFRIAPLETDPNAGSGSEREAPSFNAEGARKISRLRSHPDAAERANKALFHDQGIVLSWLDPESSIRLVALERDSGTEVRSVDAVILAMEQAIRPLNTGTAMWMDSLTTARVGVFNDIDIVDGLGAFSELVSLAIPDTSDVDAEDRLAVVAAARRDAPRTGVGFRYLKAKKNYTKVSTASDTLADLPLPEVALNYLSGFAGSFTDQPFGTSITEHNTGSDVIDSELKYRLYFRVRQVHNRTGIEIRYDVQSYTVEQAIEVLARFRLALTEILSAT